MQRNTSPSRIQVINIMSTICAAVNSALRVYIGNAFLLRTLNDKYLQAFHSMLASLTMGQGDLNIIFMLEGFFEGRLLTERYTNLFAFLC